MDDFELYIKQSEDRRALKNRKFFKLVSDTIGHDGRLLSELMALKVAERFGIDFHGVAYTPCYKLANHYIMNDDIEMGFVEWLYCDDAPFLTSLYKIGKYFPEFKEIAESDKEIVELANKFYGLDLKIDGDWYTEYVYSFSLNFNSFTPIKMDEVVELKREISFCKKYGLETEELEGKLAEYGLPEEILKEETL